jgi:hypothetical protein
MEFDYNNPETWGHCEIIMYLAGLKGRPSMRGDEAIIERAIKLLSDAAPGGEED